MNKTILKSALLALIAVTGTAHAVPVSGQGTWETTLLGRDINGYAVAATDERAVFLYDTDLGITWLRDWGTAGRRMSWSAARGWAQTLTVGGFGGWSLPTAKNQDGSGPCFQYYCDSQMGHLYFAELGNEAEGRSLNLGPFINVASFPAYYWSDTQFLDNTDKAWLIDARTGYQWHSYKESGVEVTAVRLGDVLVSQVPEPETYALMLVGLAAVGAAARRRQSVNAGAKRAAP